MSERSTVTTGAARARYARFLPLLWAFAGSLLTYSVSSSGLIFPAYLMDLQIGVLVGIVAALLADTVVAACAGAVLGILVGLALGVTRLPPDLTALAYVLASAVATAAVVRIVARSAPWGRRAALGFGVLLVAVNLWATALTLVPMATVAGENRSMAQEMNARVQAGKFATDDEMYREIVWTMRSGRPYYEAVGLSWKRLMWGSPNSLFDVRQPTMFWLWSSLPAWPLSALWAYLAFATIAIIAAPIVIFRAAPGGLGLAGSATIGAYLLAFLLRLGGSRASVTPIFLAEPWVGALAVAVLAAFVLAQRERGHKPWMIASAALAVVAMISRELMVYLMLAGIAASLAAPRERRRFDLTVWVVAFASALAYWGVHASRARQLITGAPQLGGFWMTHGGWDYLMRGVTQFTTFVSSNLWVPVVLVVMAVVGALIQPDREFRVFASAVVLMPLIGFLFAGNSAIDITNNVRYNYWAAIVLPSAYALAPSALLLLPGLRRPAPAQATEERYESAEETETAAGA